MTINLTPQAVAGPVPAGARGDPGLYPSAAWAAINYAKNSVVAHLNCVWRANVATAQEPAFDGSGAVSSSDWDLWIDGRGAALAGGYAASALASKNDAATALTTIQATVHALSALEMAPAANDAAALAWAAAQTPPIVPITGSRYWNTTEANFRVWNATSSTFADEDADAQTQRANAAAAAGAAAGSASGALYSKNASDADAIATAADRAQTGLDRIATGGDRTQTGLDRIQTGADVVAAGNAAGAAGGSATAADNSNSAGQAALLNTVSYAAIAQAGAATASTVTGLSILAAAQRAIKMTTTGNSACPYDATKDDDGGAWIKKSTTQSYLSDTLNTAARGIVVAMPLQSAVIGEPTILSVFSNIDGTGSLWKSWAVAGLTCVAARNGWIMYGGPYGLIVLDLISDKIFLNNSGGMYVCSNQNVSTYNQGTATWAFVSSAGAIINAAVNSISATITPNTPLNPRRYNLPNPTVAVGTTGGGSVIRWDGIVTNSAATLAFSSVTFDDKGNLWLLFSSGSLYVCSPATYQTASFNVAALISFTLAQLIISSPAKIAACGPGIVAVSGSTGLARIKLDPTNPANSLINIKTTTYDTGWMVLGKTVLALAESSADLSSMVGGERIINGATPSLVSGWTASDGGTTLSAGLLTIDATAQYASQAMTTTIGQTYIVRWTAAAGTASPKFCLGTSSGAINIVAQAATGAQAWSFVATTTATYISLATASGTAGQNCTYTNISFKLAASDKSASGNLPAVVGSVTRAVVASGADTAVYSGFSSSNFFRLSQVAAINMGSTDFAAVCPITLPSTGAYSTICHYSDETGASYGGAAYWFLRVASDGTLSAVLYDGANIASVTTTATVPTSGVHNIGFARRGSYGEWYLDGVRVSRSSLGSVGSLTNTSANLLIGASYNNSSIIYPAVGNLGKLRLFNYAPTPDQFAFMMADEAPVNSANAQSLLTGANVLGVAFDPDTNQLAAPNSTAGCDVFSGSVRVANYNSATGSVNLKPAIDFITYNNNWGGCSLGAPASAFSTWGGLGYPMVDTVTNTAHQVVSSVIAALAATIYNMTIPIKAAALGWARVGLKNTIYADINLATGAVGYTAGSPTVTVTALASGEWLVTISATPGPVSLYPFIGCQPANNTSNYAGAGTATIIFGKPMITTGATIPTAYVDGLSGSANAKAAAVAGGKLAVVTANGADVWIPSADGLRAVNDAVGSSKRPFYDPLRSVVTWDTANATPVNVPLFLVPDGKSFDFIVRPSAKSSDSAYTNKLKWTAIEGQAVRPTGSVVYAKGSTPTLIDPASSTAGIAIGYDTTNNLVYATLTGLAANLDWTLACEIVWTNIQQAA